MLEESWRQTLAKSAEIVSDLRKASAFNELPLMQSEIDYDVEERKQK